MDSLAGLLMNTTKVHSVSFPQGNLRGDITAEELLEKYWQYGQNPHYTNETSWYKSGETKEVVRNAERVSVD